MFLDPRRVGYLLPLLVPVLRNDALVHEAVVRYMGALRAYISLSDGREVTLDYFTTPDERPRCFDVTHLYLDSSGSIVEVIYRDSCLQEAQHVS